MKIVTIVRGLPGSGKSTFAHSIADEVFEADDYFTNENGEYNHDASKLKEAHADCFARFSEAITRGCERIAVSNTSTKVWEFEKYKQFAEENGYTVFVVIAENRHDGKNSHGVPQDALDRMRKKFEVKL